MTSRHSKLILDISATMVMLIKSTGNYVVNQIPLKSDKQAYINSLNRCIAVFDEKLENIDMIRARLNGLFSEASHIYKPTIFNSQQYQIKHHDLAIRHALDIVNCLESRFLIGGGSVNTNFLEERKVFK